jgi:hypothetical protein
VCQSLGIESTATPRWDRSLTRVQIGAGVVGVLIALSSIGEGPVVARLLRLAGYPVACAAIVRWVPIVRHRRADWLVAHELGMAAICIGWALVPSWGGVAVNGAWGLMALAWWTAAPTRRGAVEGPG